MTVMNHREKSVYLFPPSVAGSDRVVAGIVISFMFVGGRIKLKTKPSTKQRDGCNDDMERERKMNYKCKKDLDYFR